MGGFYLPVLEKFAYHLPYVKILSKNGCGASRKQAFLNLPLSVYSHRDYAERLSAVFNDQAQSDHFGNDRSLSIEGCSIEMHSPEEGCGTTMEFHSHFSDDSKQDAASTHANMETLIKHLMQTGRMKEGSVMFDGTDGCSKQYRCGAALFLLSLLSSLHRIVIDRMIGAPGHGKDIVDGLNATDKRFLAQKMTMIGRPEESNEDTNRMAAYSMVEGASNSLARECARLCSNASRSAGVKSEGKYAKRESNATMKMRNYHITELKDVCFPDLKMKAVMENERGTRNGISSMYNIRSDPDLGLGRVAVRRVPCSCDACMTQLKQPWIPGVDANNQPRYASSVDCSLSPIFEGLNDWKLAILQPTTANSDEDLEHAQTVVLDRIAEDARKEIRIGSYGAFATEDPDADGYYVVEWIGLPMILVDATLLTEFDPPIMLQEGELVARAKYFNKVPRANRWYTTSEVETTVRLQQVLAPDLTLQPISEENRLPNSCDRRKAAQLGAKRVSNSDHHSILDEISRSAIMDHEELQFEEEEEEEDRLEEESGEEEDGEEEE
jgi:hypothetical protein